MWQLVSVVLFSWLYVDRPANLQPTEKHNTYELLYIYSIPPDDGLQICPKHVEADWRNKLRINGTSSWFLLHRYIEMHGQQTIKFNSVSLIPNFLHVQANCEIWGSYIGVDEDSSLLGCYAMAIGS